MHLSNFSLTGDGQMIALDAEGLKWDLHNHADFEGFDYSTTAPHSTFTLKWHIAERVIKWRDAGCQYGVPNYPTDGFNLIFSDVSYLEIVPRDLKMPRDEDLGISSVSCVEADGEKLSEAFPYLPYNVPCEETLSFHLLFRFNGGQIIRIGAKNAEFVLVDKVR